MSYPLDLVYLWNSLWLFGNFTVKAIGCYRDTSRRSIPGYNGKIFLSKTITGDEQTLFWSVLWLLWDLVTEPLLYSIRDGVLLVRELTWPTESMDGVIDVEMARGDHGLMMFTLYLVRLMFVKQNTLHKAKIRASVKVSMVFFKVESKWGINFSRSKYDQTIKIALYYWKSTEKNIPVDGRMKEVQIVFNWWFKSITPRAIKKKQE